MTPGTAVARLAALISERPEFTEDDLYQAMREAGIPDPVADRAFKFTQIAWGRVFLDGLGVTFAPDYSCLNGAGEVVESGRLAEQPYFMAAMAAAKNGGHTPGLSRLALMSAEVDAVNKALKAGSKPVDLVTAPAVLFMEPPTPAGVGQAQRLLSRRIAPPKPWWRVW